MIPAGYTDFRNIARRRLPRFLFDYIEGGSYDEITMRANRTDLEDIRLRQRVMRDVDSIETATTLLGQRASFPVGLAPIGLAGLYARRGETQAARAAHASGIPFILSSCSCCGIEEVVTAADSPVCLQLYVIRDRSFIVDLLQRAAALGVTTLILTVDLIIHGPRRRDIRSSLTGSHDLAARINRMFEIARHPRWMWDVGLRGRPHTLGNFAPVMKEGAGLTQFTDWVSRNFDASVTWEDMAWLRQHWKGAIVVKGILDPQDAVAACDAGADGIVISNHGGRQLDGAPSTIMALSGVVAAVGSRTPILLDGGIRSGTDVLRALALGAKGVLLGRPWAYALAAGGGAGVTRMIELLHHEFRVAMALTGQTDVNALSPDLVLPPQGPDSRSRHPHAHV